MPLQEGCKFGNFFLKSYNHGTEPYRSIPPEVFRLPKAYSDSFAKTKSKKSDNPYLPKFKHSQSFMEPNDNNNNVNPFSLSETQLKNKYVARVATAAQGNFLQSSKMLVQKTAHSIPVMLLIKKKKKSV